MFVKIKIKDIGDGDKFYKFIHTFMMELTDEEREIVEDESFRDYSVEIYSNDKELITISAKSDKK